jgi:hypothetical protein
VKRVAIAALVAVVMLPGVGVGTARGQAIVAERFDAGLNGWSVYADADSLVWDATGGNPGGAARARDQGSGGWWGFLAGPAFLGDRSCMYGGTLAWQSKTNGVNSAGNSQADVAIEGGGLVLVYDVPNPVVNVWAVRNLTLTETAGWRLTTIGGAVPTEAQFRTVLANVTAVKFRGEFTSASGGDIGFIDNVVMGAFTLASPESVLTCPANAVVLSVTAAGPNPLTYRWQWRATPDAAWIDVVDGLNVDPLGGGDQFVASGASTTAVTASQFGAAGSGAVVLEWEHRCVVADACDSAASIPATLIVCPSDFNCDGFVDFFDYDDYVNCFESGTCAGGGTADFNGDGFVDFFDYDDYVAAFEAGC